MILGKRVRLEPNKSQTVLFKQFSGASRFVWNKSKALDETIWKTEGRYATIKDLMKSLQDLKYNNPDYAWLNSIPEAITKQSMKDLLKAYKAAFTKRKQDSSKTKNKYLPNFKKKTKDNSFYQGTDKIHKVGNTHIKITGVKKPVKCKALKGIDLPERILNPRITFDGKYWYLSYSFEVDTFNTTYIPTIDKLGIDLGIKDLATLSNGVHFPNINKTRTVKLLRRRLQRLQRQISRKYESNVVYNDGKKVYHKTSNIRKLEKHLILINRRITNIRNTYMYGVVNSLLKTKAGSIYLEDLNIGGMLQNPRIAKSIQEQNLHKFKQILTYKCKQNNIPLYLVDRWYPSSKLCSCCGWCNNNLKLTDRVFRCSNCGLVLDRDENASLNIANCPSGKLKRIA